MYIYIYVYIYIYMLTPPRTYILIKNKQQHVAYMYHTTIMHAHKHVPTTTKSQALQQQHFLPTEGLKFQ